jgi:arylsulfatase A-like enzyme
MRDVNPNVLTIPQYFKDEGYQTAATGKIFDYRCVDGRLPHDAPSWSIPYRLAPKNEDERYGCVNPKFVEKVKAIEQDLIKKNGKASYNGVIKALGKIPSYEGSEDVSDLAYEDGRMVETAKTLLSELKDSENPFFLGVGFKKPHLPFVAPKKYWDLYKREDFSLPKYKNRPKGSPTFAMQDSWELKYGAYEKVMNGKRFDEEYQLTLTHGYHACISYIDQLIGDLLAEVDRLGLKENTIVLLWGDHGFHLGDHGMWCKHTNYEQATRSPLIFVDPRFEHGSSHTHLPVEFIDIFPTLCEQAGLEIPSQCDGRSFLSVLKGGDEHRDAAVSQFPRNFEGRQIMGYAFRTERYRYVEWVDNRFFEDPKATGQRVAVELFDYHKDPEERENLAKNPEYAKVLAGMQEIARSMKVSRAID